MARATATTPESPDMQTALEAARQRQRALWAETGAAPDGTYPVADVQWVPRRFPIQVAALAQLAAEIPRLQHAVDEATAARRARGEQTRLARQRPRIQRLDELLAEAARVNDEIAAEAPELTWFALTRADDNSLADHWRETRRADGLLD